MAAKLLVADLLVLAAVALGRRRSHLAVAALGAVVLAVAVAEVGYRLAWDQLALWDVVVGTDIRGIAEAWHPRTRFVVVGGLDGTPEGYRTAALTHVGVPALVLLGLGGLWWLRQRRRRSSS